MKRGILLILFMFISLGMNYAQLNNQPCVIHFEKMTSEKDNFKIVVDIYNSENDYKSVEQNYDSDNTDFLYYLDDIPTKIFFQAYKEKKHKDKAKDSDWFYPNKTDQIQDFHFGHNPNILWWELKEKCAQKITITKLNFSSTNNNNKKNYCKYDTIKLVWDPIPTAANIYRYGESKQLAYTNASECQLKSSSFLTSEDFYNPNSNYKNIVMTMVSDEIINRKNGTKVNLHFSTELPYIFFDDVKVKGDFSLVDNTLYLPELSSTQTIVMSNLAKGNFHAIEEDSKTYDLGNYYGYYQLEVQEDKKCPVTFNLVHPKLTLNEVVKNSGNQFWYPGEKRNDVLNLTLYSLDNSEIGNYKAEELNFEPKMELLTKSQEPILYQKDGGEEGSAKYNSFVYSLINSTDLSLDTISITSTNPKFITVKKSISLKSYPKIDTPDVTISPITCYYDTVKIEKVDVKGGLENGKYKYILSEGDKKKEFDELPITFSKEDFGLGEHTFSLTVEDAQEPEGDTGHEERKSTQSGIKFSFPDELKILKTDIDSLLCHNDNTGRIEITDYTPQREDIGFYVLSNKDTISKAFVTEGLAAKEYNLVIHDNKGCKNDSLFVNVFQPDTLDIENLVVKNPKCFGYSDGYINYDVTGGTGEKSFIWNDGFTEKDREQIPVGEYSVTITDKNNCLINKQMTLTQPEKLNNYFTGDYKICTGSSLTIDSKKYDSTDVFKEFLWMDENSNIYSQEQILQFDSTNCGKYILISFDEKKYDNARKDGAEIQCHTADTLNISMSSERFDKSFLVASQSYFGDTIVLVNDTRNDDFDFKFDIPEELEEIGIQDKFYDYIVASKPGVYNLIMSIEGDDCTANEYREIEILNEIRPEDYDEQFVKTVQIVSMKMGPNPNDGNFTFDLVMTEKSDVSLSLYSISRPRLLRKDELKDNNKYSKEYNENLPVGEYMLLVRTENDNKVIKFIVGK